MALVNKFTKNIQGISQPIVTNNAYWKVVNVNGNKEEILVSVEIRESKGASGSIGLMAFSFEPEMSDENFISQAYNHLKTLEMFDESTDS